MRLTITSEEIFDLKCGNIPKSLLEKIKIEENKEPSENLVKGMENARKLRSERIQKRIERSIFELFFENKKISVYSVAKKAKISYNTVNKNNEMKKIIEKKEKERNKISFKEIDS